VVDVILSFNNILKMNLKITLMLFERPICKFLLNATLGKTIFLGFQMR